MESNGQIGSVMVSTITKNILTNNFPNSYQFQKSCDVLIKSINEKISGHIIYSVSDSTELI